VNDRNKMSAVSTGVHRLGYVAGYGRKGEKSNVGLAESRVNSPNATILFRRTPGRTTQDPNPLLSFANWRRCHKGHRVKEIEFRTAPGNPRDSFAEVDGQPCRR